MASDEIPGFTEVKTLATIKKETPIYELSDFSGGTLTFGPPRSMSSLAGGPVFVEWTHCDTIRPSLEPPESPSRDHYELLDLTEEQSRATFPSLTDDLDATVALGPFTLTPSQDTGPLQARIKDNQLYIIHAERKRLPVPELFKSRTAALHQIHRALLTSPSSDPLPDTIFTLNTRDQPYGSAFQYGRPAWAAPGGSLPHLTRAFIIPPFAMWSWPLPSVGSLKHAGDRINIIEGSEGGKGVALADKDPRVVWWGSTRFEGVHFPTLRTDLLRVVAESENGNANGSSWAEIGALEGYDVLDESWGKEDSATKGGGRQRSDLAFALAMMIEDFCRYMYVLYTDGTSYSGRLPFHQLCNSVLISAPIAWRQYTTHLIKPMFSSDLARFSETTAIMEREQRDHPLSSLHNEGVQMAWPIHYGPDDANAVFVSPDWSDLESTVRWLEDHPEVAKGIARRQRDMFVGEWYLSPAAEVCYWRALIRAWSSVV
ncbi:glycosyl transferase family 90-domain-containing protein [Xylariaceae sp. FL0255]|nr:glycosyl transferase family 90-domain-containing protein [Xylariaceae sp. FL0255]